MSLAYLAYRSDKELKIGKLLRRQKNKLLVADAGGRTDSVKPSSVVVEFAAQNFAGAVDALVLTERIDEAAGEIDSQLLWEIFVDASLELDPERAAEEYFGTTSSVTIAAAAKVLLQDTLHFRPKAESFLPRTRSEVDELEQRERREAEKAAFLERARSFLQDLITRREPPSEVPEELQPMVGRIESFMFRNDNPEAESLLSDVAGRRPVREVGVEVLEKLGRLNRNVDPQLLLHGIVADFSEPVRRHVESLSPFAAAREPHCRTDFRQLLSFSIDDDSTREVDDALSVRFNEEGRCEAGIHIADPGVFVAKGDCVDQAAAERALTLYLATCAATMLPERIGCDLASLERGQERPSLSVTVEFDQTGTVHDFRVERGVLQVQHRLSYEDADTILAGEEEGDEEVDGSGGNKVDALAVALSKLSELAEALQQTRISRGALIFPRPELVVSARDDDISVKRVEPDSPSRTLVGEFMVLANRLVAEFALSRDLPIIYRTQPPPGGPVEPPSSYDPVKFERAVRMMRPTKFSTHPQPHSSLALDVYTQISSPLRRFNDLAIHRQVAACLDAEPAPYTVTELIEVLGQAEKVERANKRIEREVANYWLLEYLRRNYKGEQLTATVVDPAGKLRLAELDYFMVRGVLQGAEKSRPGSRLSVRVAEVRPRKNRMVLQG